MKLGERANNKEVSIPLARTESKSVIGLQNNAWRCVLAEACKLRWYSGKEPQGMKI
jgi:hypothetical protein